MGTYARWALIRGWVLIKFSLFSTSVVVYFATKHANTKKRRCNKSKVCVKYSEENSIFGRVSYYLLFEFLWEGVGWGVRLFEAGHLLTFSAFRMGAYSRWALIRGWALIRINMVSTFLLQWRLLHVLQPDYVN